MSAGLATSGCRVNENDIHRWESTAHGPDKLRAVLFHDKYDTALRVEAATSLIRMKPRQGRRVGIGILVETLASIAPEARQPIVAALVPSIIAELRKPPPVAEPGKPAPPDTSFPYKDAAYAMLTSDRTAIIADEGLKEGLKAALIDWAMADFEHRLVDRSQAYGMEQLLRLIGPTAVAGLPKLMTRDATRLDQMASLVAEHGDAATKEAASANLVAIAQFVSSDEWTKLKKPELEAANAASKLTPTEKQFEAQLAQYQEEEIFRVFGSMKKLGGRPSVDFLLGFAANKDQPEKRRQAALAALEGRLDRSNPSDIQRILEIATADAPDVVLDQAFRRVSEMPRELVVDKLYGLFRTDKWKIRRTAATTILKMSTVKHIDEFLGRLPEPKGFAMPEALTYGAYFGDLKEGSPLEALKKHFTAGPAPARASAIAYYFTYGTTADLPAVKPLEGDTTRAPVCEADPDCKWACEVPKEGSNERELRDVKTIGEFVQLCVVPAMQQRQPEREKGEKK
ncbi:hypothetical protein [Sorangium cellulosum]|uniref:hypothetical protein n=1 Tax=Sorangium cellulosum TaxID=56 RepID=UPI001F273A8A|nr:hypothetical protein [Sorangium cellulosum]